ncbi:hypothetical protein TNCV_4083991 [Trichonephila clavipes]|nr:hypothetical protein TNCV_4083991 [Trichonephila clavipes]
MLKASIVHNEIQAGTCSGMDKAPCGGWCKSLGSKLRKISEVPSYQEDFDTLRMDLNHATINRSNTDSADRKPVDTGSYTRWNHAYGSVHRGTGMHRINFSQEEIMDNHINRT